MSRYFRMLVVLACTVPGIAGATGDPPTGRFIVTLRADPGDEPGRRAALARDTGSAERHLRARANALTARAALPAAETRALGDDVVNLVGPSGMSPAEEARWLTRLAADPEVQSVDVDQRRFVRAVAADDLYPEQWYLQSGDYAAARVDAAWDITTGLDETVVAVLDTGVRFEHPDLGRVGEGGRLLPGYDFVSGETPTSFLTANDGDGWDPDPSDPGDWVSSEDRQQAVFSNCGREDSSWHGTRVAGMLGAVTNNGTGMAGGTWSGRVLPVRVLGKCGGYDSDIIAGMRWAAGISVPGAPPNPNPAKVLNMSLGGVGTCTNAYRNVVSQLTAAGVVIVAAAGNVAGGPIEVPARCPGVVAVNGVRHVGTKVGYSSLGPEVAVAAPAGNCVNDSGPCLRSLPTATNLGLEGPGASGYLDQWSSRPNLGTSFAAPIVTVVVALMHGVNANLRPPEVLARLQASATPFPPRDPTLPTCPALAPVTSQCNCTPTTCGAGIANALGAVTAARNPIARIATPPSTAPGATVTLDGTASAAARDRTIASYSWTVDSGPPGLEIADAGSAIATVVAPGNGAATLRLTVTDDAGRTDSATLSVGGGSPDPGGPVASGGGGGGSHPVQAALLGLVGLIGRRRRPHAQR